MFKLVVLCALLAAVAAKPGALLAPYLAPLAYSSTLVAPATTTITKQASSVVHPSPYTTYYSAPYFAHYIKKRSAPLFAAPYLVPNIVSPALPARLLTPYPLRAPLLHTPIVYSAPAHYIKKRSVGLLPAVPALPTLPLTYAAAPALPIIPHAPLFPTPVIHTPIAYPHLIKKRSAFLSTYLAPAAYSHQSRVDVRHSAPLITTYTAPITYASPFGYSHIL